MLPKKAESRDKEFVHFVLSCFLTTISAIVSCHVQYVSTEEFQRNALSMNMTLSKCTTDLLGKHL